MAYYSTTATLIHRNNDPQLRLLLYAPTFSLRSSAGCLPRPQDPDLPFPPASLDPTQGTATSNGNCSAASASASVRIELSRTSSHIARPRPRASPAPNPPPANNKR